MTKFTRRKDEGGNIMRYRRLLRSFLRCNIEIEKRQFKWSEQREEVEWHTIL